MTTCETSEQERGERCEYCAQDTKHEKPNHRERKEGATAVSVLTKSRKKKPCQTAGGTTTDATHRRRQLACHAYIQAERSGRRHNLSTER